jgi:hypothetical protein
MKPRLKLGMLVATMACLVVICCLGQAMADSSIIVDRGMPEWNGLTGSGSNINGINNPNRVNTSTQYTYNPGEPSNSPTSYTILGDTVSIVSGYQIDSIKVWMLYSSNLALTSLPSDVASSLKLWFGPVGGTLISYAVNQPSISRFYYDGTGSNSTYANFERGDLAYRALWQLSFTIDPNTTVAAGNYEFFLDGLFYSSGDNSWHSPSLHLANTTQMGADNKFYTLAINDGATGTVTEVDSTSFFPAMHGADANVQVYAHLAPSGVPLPSTLLLLGSGLLGLAGVKRRFKRN